MKENKQSKSLIFLGIVMLLVLSSSVFLITKYYPKNDTKTDLINIDSLSKEFIDEYLEESKNINEEDKENILIITSMKNIKDTYGATNVIEAPNNQYILQYENADMKDKALSRFNDDDSIISAEENGYYTIDQTVYNSWGVESMSLDYATDFVNTKGLNEVTVAIIDTGLNVDLANKYYNGKIAEVYNVLENSTSVMNDENGHGTHIFGTIAESTPTNVKILPIKVSRNGNLYYSDIIAAINYVTANNKADVLNMSFGGYYYNQALETAIEGAKSKNIISVAAAGNDNSHNDHYPSSLNNTISIASVDSNLSKSSFSNYGNKISFTAPGGNIKSIMSSDTQISKNNGNNDDDDHEIISGTSMATPHAVSAIAILKSFNKNLTLDNTVELLKTRAVDLGDPGWDRFYGYGLISFRNAQFCDGNACDSYNVFKEDTSIVPVKMEVKYPLRTNYNYGTLNNLGPTQVLIYDSNDNHTVAKLGELEGAQITGYDPYSTTEQTISVKWQGLETTFSFTNPTDWECGWTYEIVENNNVIITGFNDFNIDKNINLYIPENIEKYNVVAIGNEKNNFSIFKNANIGTYKNLILPKSLTEIKGTDTFSNFTNLNKVFVMSSGLSITGTGAFKNDENLVHITGKIDSLGNNTFENNRSLETITLSKNITTIPNFAFEGCTSLEKIVIPDSVVSIGINAFHHNFKLNNVSLPTGLKTIGDYAFSYSGIDNIVFPVSLEKIGEEAFRGTGIRNLNIPKNVTFIGANAFTECSSINEIVVDAANTIYDSRENSNALIETKTNTIIKGNPNTKIPKSVTSIGSNAFSYDLRFIEVQIPNNITSIGTYAFYECNFLEDVIIPSSVVSIGDYAFSISAYEPIIIFTYSDAYAKTYATQKKIEYLVMEPTDVLVSMSKKYFKSFEKVNINTDITNVILTYEHGVIDGDIYKVIKERASETDGYEVKYINNNDSFRYGDTYYILKGVNIFGLDYESKVNINVSKATPVYTIPTNLKANTGQKLSEIVLPEGFEWMNPDDVITGSGNVVFKGKYTPSDTYNYEIVENIDITVMVNKVKEKIVPNIVITDKIYDGTSTISKDNVVISNLGNTEYNIINLTSSGIEVGSYNATIKLKLTDEKFINYTFDDGTQEKEFTVKYKIVQATPKYTIPTGLTAKAGQKLSDIALPEGFEWMNPNEVIVESENMVYKAKYIPTDLKNYKVVENIDIVLNKKIIKYNVIFNSNYGENITLSQEIECDKDTALKTNTFVRDGYVFKNWNTKPDGKGTVYTDKQIININSDLTLYAQWEKSNTFINKSTDYEGIYDGKEHSININISPSNYTIRYSLDNSYNLKELPMFLFVGEYTVNYKVTNTGYKDLIGSNKVKIYGIKDMDKSLDLKEDIIIANNNSFRDLISKINIYSNTNKVTHLDANKKEDKTDVLKTGDYINININGMDDILYLVSIIGDINSDGKISSADYVKIKKHIMQTEVISNNIYLYASDVNKDNNITSADYVKIKKYIMNGEGL